MGSKFSANAGLILSYLREYVGAAGNYKLPANAAFLIA
jgi:hypothetical protein